MTLTRTLRFPVSATHNSGHCSVLSALHCQRNRAPSSNPPAMSQKYSLFTCKQSILHSHIARIQMIPI